MNIQTGKGMGIKTPGMQLQTSKGMGIKTSHGMGIKTSKGMQLSSSKNYFTFNEYARKRSYFFGDRGKLKAQPNKESQKPAVAKPKDQRTYMKAEPVKREHHRQHKTVVHRAEHGAQFTPLVYRATWPPSHQPDDFSDRFPVTCDCPFCCLQEARADTRW